MLARHYGSMPRITSMHTDRVGPTRRPLVHRQPNQPTPINHQDPYPTTPPTHSHPGHITSARPLPTQRAENGTSDRVPLVVRTTLWQRWLCAIDFGDGFWTWLAALAAGEWRLSQKPPSILRQRRH